MLLAFTPCITFAGDGKGENSFCQHAIDSLDSVLSEYNSSNRLRIIDVLTQKVSYVEKCGDDKSKIDTYIQLSVNYLDATDYVSTLQFLQKANKIANKINDSLSKISIYNLKGNTFSEINEHHTSISQYQKGVELAEQIQDTFYLAIFYNNIAIAYEGVEDFERAEKYYVKALRYHEILDSKVDIALIYLNIGDLKTQLKAFDLAKKYQFKARNLLHRLEDVEELLFILYIGIAEREIQEKNYITAKEYLDSSLTFNYHPRLNDWEYFYQLRAESNYNLGHYEKAYEDILKMESFKDSTFNSEVYNEIKSIQISSIKENTQAQLEALKKNNQIKDLELQKDEIAQRNYFLFLIAIGLALALAVFLFFYIRRDSKKLRKRSQVIEDQNKDIALKNEQLENLNQSMINSINYAKRLQNAILPSKEILNEQFSFDSIFLPKDVVSGDFYWYAQPANFDNDEFLFAVADCTGHGVPGAMVSVVCANALNKVVYDEKIDDPGKILDRTKHHVENTFKTSKQLKDGMDITLIHVRKNKNDNKNSKQTYTLNYAGANNPLWIIRDKNHGSNLTVKNINTSEIVHKNPNYSLDNFHLFDLNPDKQPVGAYEYAKPFQTQQITVLSNDVLYLFSDGIYDQFGNIQKYPNGKKLNKSRLKKLLLENSKIDLKNQIATLNKFFMEWKEGLDQVDDICVFAIQLDKTKKD